MSTASCDSCKDQAVNYAHCGGQAHFWLRRVHSLAGIVFGGYIVVHLLVNATGLWPKVFQQNVDQIHKMEPMLPLIELAAIFTPLLIHVLYGIYIAGSGVSYATTFKYNYGGNFRYLLQRITGILLLVFIVYHVGMLHKWGFALIGLKKAPDFEAVNTAYQSTVHSIKNQFANPAVNYAVIMLYLVGVWSAAFHFANGLWTAAIAWGLTTTRTSQKRWGHVCCGAGIGLMLVGTVAWYAFAVKGDANYPVEKTETVKPYVIDGKAYNIPIHEIESKLEHKEVKPEGTTQPHE